jgi:hypothetical protein
VGPRAVLEVVVKRKIPSPHRELNPRTPKMGLYKITKISEHNERIWPKELLISQMKVTFRIEQQAFGVRIKVCAPDMTEGATGCNRTSAVSQIAAQSSFAFPLHRIVFRF